MYSQKYLKYKNKYLELKFGGGISMDMNNELTKIGNKIKVDNTNNILSYILSIMKLKYLHLQMNKK